MTHWGEHGIKPDVALKLSADQEANVMAMLMAKDIDYDGLMHIDPYLQKAAHLLGERR